MDKVLVTLETESQQIKGNSKEANHQGKFEASYVTYEIGTTRTQSNTSTSGNRYATPFTIVTQTSNSLLLNVIHKDETFKTVKVEFASFDKGKLEVLRTITLKDARLNSYKEQPATLANNSTVPVIKLEFAYKELESTDHETSQVGNVQFAEYQNGGNGNAPVAVQM